MYNDFFGFEDEPFRLTPDPDFFYCSPIHEEAIGIIEYGINSRKGFMMLTGDVGTGKTTLCRVLLDKLINVETSLILNPLLSSNEILKSIVTDFGISYPADAGEGELYNILAAYFTTLYRNGKNALIVVDEAQNLSFESFEMIRQISNIEMENAKLVQILVVGQTELPDKLARHEYRQLAQRISLTAELQAFSFEETENYVNHRLHHALRFNKYLFSKKAMKSLYQRSKGCPREINQLADHALLIASSNEKKKVSAADISEAATAYKVGSGFRKPKPNRLVFPLVVSLIAICVAALYGAGYIDVKINKESLGGSTSVTENTDRKSKSEVSSDDELVKIKEDVVVKTKKNQETVKSRVFFEEPKPITEIEEEMCVKLKSNMNFRFEPLLIDNIIEVLPLDSEYKLMDNKNGWIKLQSKGVTGWIASDQNFVTLMECGDK